MCVYMESAAASVGVFELSRDSAVIVQRFLSDSAVFALELSSDFWGDPAVIVQ
jgi:hypothetical protein